MTPRALSRLTLTTALVILLAAAAPGGADDWPQLRGPHRDGVSAETGFARGWPEGGPEVLWRKPLGSGFSGIAAAGGRLFTQLGDGEHELAVRLDPATGAEIWRTPIGPLFTETFGNGPRSTPTVDGDRLYVLSSTGRLSALAAEDGAKLWQVELTELGAQVPLRGFAPSPLVEGNLVILEAGAGEGKAILAFAKDTGELSWSLRDTRAGYVSPLAVTLGGVRQIVFVPSAGEEIVSVLPSGEVFWTHPWLPGTIAMPLFVPPNRIFVSSIDDAGAMVLEVGVENGKPVVEEVWKSRRMKNHFSSSVYYDGHVYGFDQGTLKCLSAADGEQCWAVRGLGKGSLVAADGLLIVLSDRGKLVLAEATPGEYRELASMQALEGRSWTAPALADGRLYLRNHEEIVCLALPKKEAASHG